VIGIMLGLPFLTFTLSRNFIGANGSVAVIVFGCMMAVERVTIWERMNLLLFHFWQELAILLDVLICLNISHYNAVKVWPNLTTADFILVLVTYIMYYVVRFLCFLLFSPLLSRLGSGITFKSMLVCVWCATKSPFSLLLVILNSIRFHVSDNITITMYLHIVGIHFLSLLINGGLTPLALKILGMADISLARHVNMNNCIKHIFLKRKKTIAVLKMNKYLAAANWTLIQEITNMKHPYTRQSDINADQDDWFMEHQYTECPECKEELPHEPTARQLKDMTKEAKMRILKAKKISYSRQYENGMMSCENIRILTQAVEMAMDAEDVTIVVDGLCKRFHEQRCCYKFLRNHVQRMLPSNRMNIRQPRKYHRRVCYHIVRRKHFEIIMYCVVLLNMVLIIINITYYSIGHHTGKNETFLVLYLILTFVFYVIYLGEFFLRIMAYSWIRLWRDGFGTYFK
jgi:sodium/hydrogen exchanger 10/11